MTGRIGIDDVSPNTSSGKYPAKAVVGEAFPITAAVWREGHDAVNATLAVRGPGSSTSVHIPMTPGTEPDVFHALFTPDREGYWIARVEGWGDPIATWSHAVEAKLGVGQTASDLANDLEVGARLFDRAAAKARSADRPVLTAVAAALRSDAHLPSRVAPAFTDEVRRILRETPLRELVTRGEAINVWVDRRAALVGSWYELFPRSTGGWNEDGTPRHGTFATTVGALPRVAAMGFDVVYFPPIHPIGRVNRKGPNNTLTPGPTDVGSPWAIGAEEGGHDAVHPELGTEADFVELVRAAEKLGLEVALDLALQCAPDHPWAQAHPEWFTVLPDGTIAYAENPPKKYQDIYPVNFDNDRKGIYAEVLRVVRHWVSLGVKTFRVDNPHTKPPDFWEWLIAEVKKTDPDVLFLAEAFTRPARLYGLARRGFTQSYTYFTWRVAKWELTEFGTEIAAKADLGRPNLFVNTPDILHESLQTGGPGMFALRAALAATMSPLWGVYSGYELYEHVPVRPGSEEYLDSEKYQLRPRDYESARARGESLEPWLTTLNAIRKAHPALQQLRNIHFHHVDNDALIAYSKFDAVSGDAVLVVVNLNPFGAEEGTVWLDMPAIGRDWQSRITVTDEVGGQQFEWGQANYVKLEPWRQVAHILALPPIAEPERTTLAFRKEPS
ncbi:alpha-1,4-glucan--maltose-1-phosphate maltosyltransferase [Rhodococcoides corynebacterioides]|uniref:alpha-1,4-glucan--maltose-1-phosphate maltosyltransferase n=1 Tax=Rhodococcoides corynebacterioides TaxID=53972 RepID=UPI00082D4FF6|nr:alpha-1,4-glucan--maltose-1-phosphate maltosyltransferase [Rhodococcus corynebacterioides]MBY6352001.1 alpha-1,4-glucan--maltose-1-phosphate maltosyltransferase [Rhodococcus corynebacterioides]MBY6364288.1 alpha-1,4-glucan--maltose-1-phosphate maltosyltransferase [Rhodococcus corynebacterioides]